MKMIVLWTLSVCQKSPYKFKLPFLDDSGKKSSMSIIDWEISQLYLNLKKREKSEDIVLKKVKEKLEGFIEKNDLYLFFRDNETNAFSRK